MNTFYKFVANEEAVLSIVDGLVKFTPIPKLNDPFELTAITDEKIVANSLKHYRTQGYDEIDLKNLQSQQMLLNKLLDVSIPLPQSLNQLNSIIQSPAFDVNANALIAFLKSVQGEILNRTGVLCLSEKYDSLPMWAHYANNANGFVIEFEDLETTFSGDETQILNKVTKVEYGKAPIITFDTNSHIAPFFTKHKDWSYEKEFRVVLPLRECKFSNDIYLKEIPKNLVKRVIIGWNYLKNLDNLRGNIKDKNPEVVVVQTVLNFNTEPMISLV
jgi:hypothetical protein